MALKSTFSVPKAPEIYILDLRRCRKNWDIFENLGNFSNGNSIKEGERGVSLNSTI